MHPTELWWLVEAKLPARRRQKFGYLDEDEFYSLRDYMKRKGMLTEAEDG